MLYLQLLYALYSSCSLFFCILSIQYVAPYQRRALLLVTHSRSALIYRTKPDKILNNVVKRILAPVICSSRYAPMPRAIVMIIAIQEEGKAKIYLFTNSCFVGNSRYFLFLVSTFLPVLCFCHPMMSL